ncbi:hypothetical protein L596_007996 [Steinernema carpocapsae]|uniref:GPI transamidase subunit PIG-U n=1 Tax=Steinernema carpocapsae TaxID=34508 RepID=A0A4U5PB38_STECR|nr:hypothetical protein L596_007996 [Steinernema carpocapsae]
MDSILTKAISSTWFVVLTFPSQETFQQPVFLAAFDVVMDYAKALSALFIGFDVLTSLLLRRCARMYMKKEKLSVASEYVSDFPHLVFRCYLFNPLTVASCAVFNITVVSNFFVAIFLFSLLSQCGFLNGCITGLLIHQNLHFLPLIFVQALGNKVFSSNLKLLKGLLFTAASFAGWNALSVYLHGSAKFLPNTYGFSLLFPDLTPNVGIFWYHFCEVFEHFRSFFTWAFQLNYVVYVLPLALTLRKNPIIYFIVTLVLMSTFAPYPSLADTCVYLAILPMISDLTKYIRYTLIIGCTYVSCLILAPIMWKMWIITGSGNANFYFAVTLIFDVAQIFLATDLIYAFIRRDLRNFAPKGIDIDKAAAGFACI